MDALTFASNRMVGGILVTAFLLYVAAMLVAPPLYQDSDIGRRVATIAREQPRWLISQLFFALGILLPGAAFLLLVPQLGESRPGWLPALGAIGMGAGALLGAALVAWQTRAPTDFWQSAQTGRMIDVALWLMLPALFLFGVTLLQNGFAPWIGALLLGSMLLLAAVAVMARIAGFYLSIGIYLVTFVVGLALLRLPP